MNYIRYQLTPKILSFFMKFKNGTPPLSNIIIHERHLYDLRVDDSLAQISKITDYLEDIIQKKSL